MKKIKKILVRIIKDDTKQEEFIIDFKKWVEWCDENNLEQGFNSLHRFFLAKINKNLYNDFVQIEYLY